MINLFSVKDKVVTGDQTTADSRCVVGVLTNFRELVLAYGEYKNGLFEFGYTYFGDSRTSERFALLLMYVLSYSPSEIILQARETRRQRTISEGINSVTVQIPADESDDKHSIESIGELFKVKTNQAVKSSTRRVL